jgi:predicted RNase H-like nuclease
MMTMAGAPTAKARRLSSPARLALGVDAAWTATEPSGVALAEETPHGWRLVAVEASYPHFRARAEDVALTDRPRGEPPDVPALLAACKRLSGRTPDLVAVDMPLSHEQILGRRASDRAISSAFGARKAATHSPSALRPGALADRFRADFEAAGFALCTSDGLKTPGLMEVYPHAALLELSGDAVRLTYKAGKTTTYWPEALLEERRARVRKVWRRIVAMLEAEIEGVEAALPPPLGHARGRELKAYEDKLDAVVCAHVAIAALEGHARAYGDGVSAVWVPLPRRSCTGGALGSVIQ